MDIYIPPNPKHQNIDGKLNRAHTNTHTQKLIKIDNKKIGAHFGTTFPHLFVQTFPDCVKKVEPQIYTARLFGFRINGASLPGPRMQWLRMIPDKKDIKKDQDDDDDEDDDEEEDSKMIL